MIFCAVRAMIDNRSQCGNAGGVNLRSPYDLVGGIAHFGRMLDKLRAHARGELPDHFVGYLGYGDGTNFDGRVCRFLHVPFEAVVERVNAGASDQEILAWAFETGRKPSEQEIEVFTGFLTKRGWRDQASAELRKFAIEDGFPPEEIATFPDLHDREEGRPPRFAPDVTPYNGPVKASAIIEGLRSPYDKVGGIVHFGRMLDKIRLHDTGHLPEPWVKAKGANPSFDQVTCTFLNVNYDALTQRVLDGGSDDEVLAWAFENGRKPNDEDILIWNAYMVKRSWRDQYTARLHFRLEEAGMPAGAAFTMFDYIDLDEGRSPREYLH